MTQHRGERCIKEIGEFSEFSKGTQRYIKASLEIAFPDEDIDPVGRWSRNESEVSELRARTKAYASLRKLRATVPNTTDLLAIGSLMGPLILASGYDLGRGKLTTFHEYRFLYERLLGVKVRPFLPSAFLAAASLPTILPKHRLRLIQTITANEVATAGWSTQPALFRPEWIDM